MADLIDPNRQYSDREVRLILESAAKLQADRGEESSGGMTLAQLEQVAVEAGLDPQLVRRAASQINRVDPPTDHNAFLGAPTVIVLERVVDVSIDVSAFDQLLDVTRALTREVGEVSTIGRQFGWKGRMDGAKTEVSISATDQRTTVRVRVALEEQAVAHFMLKGVLFGGMGGLASLGFIASLTFMTPLAVAVGAVTACGGYVWSRRSLQKAAELYHRRASALLDELAARVRAASKTSSTEPHAIEPVR